MADQHSQAGGGTSAPPPGDSFQRPAAGTHAALAVAALITASVVFVLLVDRSLRRPPEIPEVLRPTASTTIVVPTRQAPAVTPVTPEPIVIDLEIREGPFEQLPTPTVVPVHTEAPARYFLVTVQSGDTLAAIASRYGYSFEEIAELNGIDEPYVIHIGDELLFPNR